MPTLGSLLAWLRRDPEMPCSISVTVFYLEKTMYLLVGSNGPQFSHTDEPWDKPWWGAASVK